MQLEGPAFFHALRRRDEAQHTVDRLVADNCPPHPLVFEGRHLARSGRLARAPAPLLMTGRE